jgi:hypothetical protein
VQPGHVLAQRGEGVADPAGITRPDRFAQIAQIVMGVVEGG